MNEKTKKALRISGRIAAWILFVVIMVFLAITIVMCLTVNQNDRSFLGHRMYIVQTDSMSKSETSGDQSVFFESGDVIFVKNADDVYALQEGDVITFISRNQESYGQTVTHKIREVKTSDQGFVIGYVTYGINTGTNDAAVVAPEHVIGVYAGKIPNIGHVFAFLKTQRGYVLSILVPSLLILIYFSVKTGKNVEKQNTEAALADMAALKEQVAANEEALAQLAALKTQAVADEDTLAKLEELQLRLLALEGRMPENGAPVEASVEEDTAVALVDVDVDGDGDFRAIKKTPFAKKLLGLEGFKQDYFNQLHNALLTYKKVSYRVSFKGMSYRYGRTLLAKITVRGKTLCLHLALDVNAFNKNVYFQKDFSDVKAYVAVPFTVKVKSERGKKNAIKLIEELQTKFSLTAKGFPSVSNSKKLLLDYLKGEKNNEDE